MSLRIKICGLSTPETLDAALDAGADLVGFVFCPTSPRHVELSTARLLGGHVAGRAAKVAVTVDADDAQLAAIVEALAPDALQLHGRESPERVSAVKARFGLPAIKALPVSTVADLADVPVYAAVADQLLFDARPPSDATRPGGFGKPFDWRLLQALDGGLDFFLSGGLDASNVAVAIAMTHTPAVDVSSGVERAPGIKDGDMIRNFIRSARCPAEASNGR